VALDCADLAPLIRFTVETLGLAAVHSEDLVAALRVGPNPLLQTAAAQPPPQASGVALVFKISTFDELLARL
jgi:hypothetical protein